MYAFQLIADACRRLPPGPLPLPVIGNLMAVGRGNPQRSLARLAERYGPLMSLRLGVVPAVVVSSADAAREILQKHNAELADRPVLDAWNAHGHRSNSVISLPPHVRWRALRKLCATELFAPSRLKALQPLRQHKVEELVRYVSERAALGEPVAVREPLFTASMNIVSRTMFSVDLDSAGLRDIVQEAAVLAAKPNVSDFFPAIAAADLQGVRRRMEPLVAHSHQVLDEVFAQRLLEREAGEPPKNDMLDAVLDKEHEWQQKGAASIINRSTIKGLFTVRCTHAQHLTVYKQYFLANKHYFSLTIIGISISINQISAKRAMFSSHNKLAFFFAVYKLGET
jgi:cytochrome P450